eukprot:m.13762 g.13762  ORF g.13762 m.13762 type:complete len:246 (-) comp6003_c0_seq1:137-874(-)
MEPVVAVILPAGGVGLRSGLDVPKQFLVVEGFPLLFYTLRSVSQCKLVGSVIIGVAEESIDQCRQWTQAWVEQGLLSPALKAIEIVCGGSTRHDTIRACVGHVTAKAVDTHPDVLIVHDAVRPFVDTKILTDVATTAMKHGAAGAVLPLISTVIKPDADGLLESSLVRSDYRASQTPQAFQTSILASAYESITDAELQHGTEVLQLVLTHTATRAKLVDCQPNVWKVTTPEDVEFFKFKLKQSQL